MMLGGDEPFHNGSTLLPFTVIDFWRWGMSNLTGNALRGIVAEYLVARALDLVSSARVEWDAVDLRTAEGVAVEVKCSGYVQSWAQRAPSRPLFDIAPKRSWDAPTNTYAPTPRRPANVYVFALHHHQDRETADPTDVSQWSFYVLPTVVLDECLSKVRRLSLGQLQRLTRPVHYRDIARSVAEAAQGRHLTAYESAYDDPPR